MFDSLYWREPLWLMVLFVPWIIILVKYYQQKKIWHKIADPDLLPWLQVHSQSSRQITSRILLAIAWLCFCVALAGPRTPQQIPPSLQGNDVSVITIIDFSRSMSAVDKKMDRIAQAQVVLQHLYTNIPAKLRIGLIIYSGHSHSLLLPTLDKALLTHYISQLHQFRPPTLGNNLVSSLQAASDMLKDLNGKNHIILLSDGDLGEKAVNATEQIAAKIKSEGLINLSVIGIGGDEAVKIPMEGYKPLIVDGKVITSRRHTTELKKITAQAGGTYYNIETIKQMNLTQVLELEKYHIDKQFYHRVLWHEYFFMPLLSGIFLSLLALQMTRKTAYKLSTLALIFFLNGCHIVNDEYHSYFSEGVQCYQLKNYVCAQHSFSSAAWSVSDKKLRGRAVFNLANTHFKLGDYAQASILFKDAQKLGIAESKTGINQQFADSLAAAVRRRLADIAKTLQRADWLSSAHKLPEGFEDRMADGIYLSQSNADKAILTGLSASERHALLERGIKRLQATNKTKSISGSDFWVPAEQNNRPQQTSGLFNSLMPIEIGLHYIPDEPVEIKGVRQW